MHTYKKTNPVYSRILYLKMLNVYSCFDLYSVYTGVTPGCLKLQYFAEVPKNKMHLKHTKTAVKTTFEWTNKSVL